MIARSNIMIDMSIIKEACGGRVQNHIGKEERSCCWACGPWDPHNALGSFKLIIRCEFGMLQGCSSEFIVSLSF